MPKEVEFFFDVGSPASYLAWTQLPAICAQMKASLVYRPMLLGGVFRATGNSSPGTVAAKGAYTFKDLERFAQRYGVRLAANPYFPIITLTLMRAVVGVQTHMPERFEEFLQVVFNAIWIDSVNMNDAGRVNSTLTAAGFDPAQVIALANDAEIKETLRSTTDEAVRRGAFGAPTMFVGDEMFFGQDRLDFVREALS